MTSDGSWQQLNSGFYSASPADHFRRRWNLLALVIAKPDEIGELLDQTLTVEQLRLHPSNESPASPGLTQSGDAAFVATEIQSLYHQASESLLRLFLAHVGRPACPWLELALLRSVREFKTRLEDEILLDARANETLRIAVHDVFLGGSGHDHTSAQTAPTLQLLQYVGSDVLKEAGLYNAVKHGLAVQSGNADLSITDDQTGSSFVRDGVAVTYLESESSGRSPGARDWYETTIWVGNSKTLYLTRMVIDSIEALWTIARARYGCGPVPGRVSLITAEAVQLAISGDLAGSAGGVTRFRRKVAETSQQAAR